MSSNDRYRGNREYRDLTVQTHYKEPGRSPRVQTRGSMNDMRFSNNSVDARRPIEDQDLIYRTRYQARPQQPQQAPNEGVRAYGDYGRSAQPQRPQVQQPQYQQPQPQRVARPAPQHIKTPQAAAEKKPEAPKPVIDTSPKVSKDQALQIDMIFKIGIMVWAAAALVITIVLLTR